MIAILYSICLYAAILAAALIGLAAICAFGYMWLICSLRAEDQDV